MPLLREQDQLPSEAILRDFASQLPPLPPAIRYYDDYEGKLRTIRYPQNLERFDIHADGRILPISFDLRSDALVALLKHVFLHLLGADLAARTAANYVLAGKRLSVSDVAKFFETGPANVQSCWAVLTAKQLQRDVYLCMKTLLRVISRYRIGGWAESYNDVISALPLPYMDKYASVRSGDAFLSVNGEAAVVRYLNDAALKSGESMGDDELREAAMLLCCYQFGMRPIQISMLTLRDMRVRHEPQEAFSTVHLTFRMVKQRNSTATKPLPRRVKQEWTPIFAEIDRRSRESGQDSAEKIFGMKSTLEASQRIIGDILRNFIAPPPIARRSAITVRTPV
ncbi:hypothetical protein [Lysobacter sp. Hz 25]|uniref:hypothetical protein n=1 Tax=Lysobacter sp. Hz 25 TaxID=3383698 RepID=UPI0038D4FF66